MLGLRAASASRSGMICEASGCRSASGDHLEQQRQVAAQTAGVQQGHAVAHRGDHLEHQVELGAPPAVDGGLAHTGPPGDRLDREPAVADRGELLHDARGGSPW